MNKRFVNIFMAIKPRGNLIAVENLCYLFGKNIPKYSELTYLNEKNGNQHYLFCVDEQVNAKQLCSKYHYEYLMNQPNIYIDNQKYNDQHQIIVQYCHMYSNYYNLIPIGKPIVKPIGKSLK